MVSWASGFVGKVWYALFLESKFQTGKSENCQPDCVAVSSLSYQHSNHPAHWAGILAAIRHNLALESIVGFYWIMFVKVTNIKGKLTGHLSAQSNFRYGHYSIQRLFYQGNCAITNCLAELIQDKRCAQSMQ